MKTCLPYSGTGVTQWSIAPVLAQLQQQISESEGTGTFPRHLQI